MRHFIVSVLVFSSFTSLHTMEQKPFEQLSREEKLHYLEKTDAEMRKQAIAYIHAKRPDNAYSLDEKAQQLRAGGLKLAKEFMCRNNPHQTALNGHFYTCTLPMLTAMGVTGLAVIFGIYNASYTILSEYIL